MWKGELQSELELWFGCKEHLMELSPGLSPWPTSSLLPCCTRPDDRIPINGHTLPLQFPFGNKSWNNAAQKKGSLLVGPWPGQVCSAGDIHWGSPQLFISIWCSLTSHWLTAPQQTWKNAKMSCCHHREGYPGMKLPELGNGGCWQKYYSFDSLFVLFLPHNSGVIKRRQNSDAAAAEHHGQRNGGWWQGKHHTDAHGPESTSLSLHKLSPSNFNASSFTHYN